MFGGTLDWLPAMSVTVTAVLAVGIAIKLMDDFVDRRMDALAGVTTWAGRLGDGSVPYCMVALVVALLLDAPVAGTLFLAAYALGMAHDLPRKLPLGLSGWQESAVALIVGVLLGGPMRMLASLAVMVFVQCVDDWADAEGDRLRGHHSFVVVLGRVETGLLSVAALVVAATLAPAVTAAVIVATAAVEWITSRGVSVVPPTKRRGASYRP